MIKFFHPIFYLILVSCNEPRGLPNGYSIKNKSTGKCEIVSPSYVAANGITSSSRIVSPNITKIAIIGGLVVGFTEPVKEVDGFSTPGGYFLLNTETKVVKEGMTKEQLQNVLRKDYRVNGLPKFE